MAISSTRSVTASVSAKMQVLVLPIPIVLNLAWLEVNHVTLWCRY